MNMHANEEKRVDELLRQKIRQVTPELPGVGFVPSVMFSIEQLKITKKSINGKREPLISRKGWLVVVLAIVVLSSLYVYTPTDGFRLQPFIDQLNRFNANYFSIFFSNFFLLALVVFVLFFLVQICLISGYMGKTQRVEE